MTARRKHVIIAASVGRYAICNLHLTPPNTVIIIQNAVVSICTDPATLAGCTTSSGDNTFVGANGIEFFNGLAYITNQVSRLFALLRSNCVLGCPTLGDRCWKWQVIVVAPGDGTLSSVT